MRSLPSLPQYTMDSLSPDESLELWVHGLTARLEVEELGGYATVHLGPRQMRELASELNRAADYIEEHNQ